MSTKTLPAPVSSKLNKSKFSLVCAGWVLLGITIMLFTGLFVTLMFMDRAVTENEIYAKLLSDKLPANLGYLYENLIAQMITASGRELYYHTWEKAGSTHYYEVDFLLPEGSKINAFEIKSSG